MIPFLDLNTPFPKINTALNVPDGLLAAGGDLSISRLLDAYSSGIFPWYSEEEPILWWSPSLRTIFSLKTFRPSRSLSRFIKKSNLKVTLNHCFEQVVQGCSEPRNDDSGTWITSEMKQAYFNLHQRGYAHSVEVWQNNLLVGGIYGVSIGKLFCGESMFSRISNGSKVALVCLAGYLRAEGFPIIDCQVENQHLMSLGALNINRNDYIDIIKPELSQSIDNNFWKPKTLNAMNLISKVLNE